MEMLWWVATRVMSSALIQKESCGVPYHELHEWVLAEALDGAHDDLDELQD